ncbi:hypothetical protein NEUTE1DRAFT_139150 [Neurospora tetrasperma FGSC 2508]|uniref:DUF3669 domain-containing protein n=1 Tax=Neurospora tetrasperma (strain FGSC 2508 / ATCC MYA-4615 / P0657) TaxID=510951 RepID=F8MP93_NEUT8|nr:uncharacterized protein NEUTE1DRAFT_139150 [Neurospora tetrasperma FGSC 2508]EGO57105.1 hypothetical protein NEUTE1DRAFT_139150 [Neurospora tetrasperma FGSC 2508]EGZ69978.1 hypothetical protein NEUTE2DRAFT_130002 [Neurospora tetrasperma FGSC 2509]
MTDDASKLWNNYVIHSKVHGGSFTSLPYHEHQAQVPECFWYGTPSTTESWGLNIKTIAVNLSFAFTKRATALWLLDFDDCSPITMDMRGLDMTVKAFLDMDCYCPKPNAYKEYGSELDFPHYSFRLCGKAVSCVLMARTRSIKKILMETVAQN